MRITFYHAFLSPVAVTYDCDGGFKPEALAPVARALGMSGHSLRASVSFPDGALRHYVVDTVDKTAVETGPGWEAVDPVTPEVR